MPALWPRLLRALRPAEDRLDRPGLLRAAAEAIEALARRGARDSVQLPTGVTVRIELQDATGPVKAWVEDPALARELDAELRNRLPTLTGPPPLLSFEVVEGERDAVRAVEREVLAAAWVRVEDGDRAGQRTPLSARRAEHFLGRGPGDEGLPNDVVLTDRAAFVSRRAAVLRHTAAGWELEALDQGELLEVTGPDGAQRPRRSLSGRARVLPGQALRFLGPSGEALTVLLEEEPR